MPAMPFLSRSALALLLVLTPGLSLAMPVPPLNPSVSESSTISGGPRRPQVLTTSDDADTLSSAEVGGPRRPGGVPADR